MKKKELDSPPRFQYRRLPDKFWPPRTNPFWRTILKPLQNWYAHHNWRIRSVIIENIEQAKGYFDSADGVLLAPNHSHEADAHVMLKVTSQLKRKTFFLAASESFLGHYGLDGWVLQRMGAFSIDREGCDRKALHTAIDLLSAANALVVFPEGEIHRLNARLKPLLDGAAFMALGAQRKAKGTIWLVPTAIRYRVCQQCLKELESAMDRLERRLVWWKAPVGASLPERIIRFGEALLTLKEKERLGKSFEVTMSLPQRIEHLIESLLLRHEKEYCSKNKKTETVPLRIKALRRELMYIWTLPTTGKKKLAGVRTALDDVQLALQLFSYPGDYISEEPSIDRMAETIEKFQEDIFGITRSIGTRRAHVSFSAPINMKQIAQSLPTRERITAVTDQLENEIQKMIFQMQ